MKVNIPYLDMSTLTAEQRRGLSFLIQFEKQAAKNEESDNWVEIAAWSFLGGLTIGLCIGLLWGWV